MDEVTLFGLAMSGESNEVIVLRPGELGFEEARDRLVGVDAVNGLGHQVGDRDLFDLVDLFVGRQLQGISDEEMLDG